MRKRAKAILITAIIVFASFIAVVSSIVFGSWFSNKEPSSTVPYFKDLMFDIQTGDLTMVWVGIVAVGLPLLLLTGLFIGGLIESMKKK